MNIIERFRKYRNGGGLVQKYQDPNGPLTEKSFKESVRKQQRALGCSLGNVYSNELADSILYNNYSRNIGRFKTAHNKVGGDYMKLDKMGIFDYGGNSKNPSPYFKGFNSAAAEEIRRLGRKKGLSDNQIAVLIESGWRESRLDHKKYGSNGNAYGVWQFDIPAGTYGKYKKSLKGKQDTLETQLDFLINEYMPTKGTFKTDYWDNPNVNLDDLAVAFLKYVEAPKLRNDPKLQDRTKRATRTIHRNLGR